MSEQSFVNRLSEELSEDVRPIYQAMIKDYQESYADYVYKGVEKEITIYKRKKNLEKSFRKLLAEVHYYLTPMSQAAAEEIADDWKYPAPYDFYNMTADPEDYAELISAQARGNHYFQVIRNGALVGFACFFENEEKLEIGLGMKPDYTGQGWGKDFFHALETFAKENYTCNCLVLNVASFNQRAQKLYQKMGFEAVSHFQRDINGSAHGFVRMEKHVLR